MKPNRSEATGDQYPGQFAPARERPLSVASDSTAFGESPARTLQGVLASRISDGFAMEAEKHVERWPRRHRMLFLVGSASALWAVTIGLASLAGALIH